MSDVITKVVKSSLMSLGGEKNKVEFAGFSFKELENCNVNRIV